MAIFIDYVLAEKIERKAYVNQDESFTDLQIFITYKFRLKFFYKLVIGYFRSYYSLTNDRSSFDNSRTTIGCVFSNKFLLLFYEECEIKFFFVLETLFVLLKNLDQNI